MKKVFSVLLVFFLLILSFNVFAQNEDISYIYADTYEELTEKVDEYIFNMFDTRQDKFTICLGGNFLDAYKKEDFNKDQSSFISPNIEKYLNSEENDYNVSVLKSYSYTDSISYYSQNNKVTQVKVVCYLEWYETIEETKYVSDWADLVVEPYVLEKMTDYDRVKSLHDYVVNEFNYDEELINKTAYSMIENETGVCSAYTQTLYALLNAAGYECRIVQNDATATPLSGKEAAHAWVMVKLYDNWYHIDPTWDDPVLVDGSHKLVYDYFLLSDDEMKADHKWSDIYPKATESYDEDAEREKTTPAKTPFRDLANFPNKLQPSPEKEAEVVETFGTKLIKFIKMLIPYLIVLLLIIVVVIILLPTFKRKEE